MNYFTLGVSFTSGLQENSLKSMCPGSSKKLYETTKNLIKNLGRSPMIDLTCKKVAGPRPSIQRKLEQTTLHVF